MTCTEGLATVVEQVSPVRQRVVICDCGAIVAVDAHGAIAPIPAHQPRQP